MLKIIGISLLICALVDLSRAQASAADSDTYTAATVEYVPSQKKDITERIRENLDVYKNLIDNAGDNNPKVDIIVFPEATLTGSSKDRKIVKEKLSETVPNPKDNVVPCDKPDGHILKELSCAAKHNNIYVVVNLSEKEICSLQTQTEANDTRPCAPDAHYLYNTNVVFDRNGTVVARYRKFNLFGQKGVFNTTHKAEHATFETDFGVRFGLFTCFDIMFNEPALGLVREGVKDFIFPTMWFSELPFLTALQIQEYWAYTNDVNLIASGASNATEGSGGSGIFAGKQGPLVSYMSKPDQDNNKLLVAPVPKLKSIAPKPKNGVLPSPRVDLSKAAAAMEKFLMKRDNDIDKFNSEVITGAFAKEICSQELCCTFNVTSEFLNKTEGKVHYEYRAIVGDIVRSFSGVTNGGVKACAIVACSGPKLENCAVRFNDTSKVEVHQIFHSIMIEGEFPAIGEVLTLPSTLTHAMIPLRAGSFNYNEGRKANDENKHVTISLRGLPVADLQTFGIYGRDFRFDSDENSSSMIKSSFAILIPIMSYFSAKCFFNM